MFIEGSKGNPNPEVTQVTALRGKQEELKCGLAQEACEANSLQNGTRIIRYLCLDRSDDLTVHLRARKDEDGSRQAERLTAVFSALFI